MKKIFLFGYYGEGNLGDDLLLRGLLEILGKDCQIGVLIKKKSKDNPYLQFKKNVISDLVRGVRWSDVVIGGGGGLFQDKTSFRSFLYYLTIIWLSLFNGKPVYLVGQSFSPLRNKYNEFLLKKSLNLCNEILVRDLFSMTYLKNIGVSSQKIFYSPDLVFLLNFPVKDKNEDIGLNFRPWKTLDLEKLEDVLLKLLREGKKLIYFVFDRQEDKKVFESLSDSLRNNISLITYDNDSFFETFSSCKFIIGMRLHSSILSVITNTPFIALSYDEKVSSFCMDINWRYVLPLLELSKIPEFLKEMDQRYGELCKYLLEIRKELKDKVKSDMEEFKKEVC
ncbi:MAG TPA: polysaccharide pyruvyl transferase CsaB [Dictyoglomaceae bacterium]|nr:polysaccharide pyruvyl transferase CsaB [Dictyoglomaceae bacterium]HOL39638.1 polysaccharide pyruvyl transferase CsaB [Dictyoglomaceae bacterium]HOP95140.1 polysaccharide pyruvyl transferase CsaB [Dictyoglomaceae bacterium]HPP15210.1 polysaccharide pyruvyl transferase CsaB [Dictyoglomaceae bacterium]HPU42616.1 polysaccharide pyruvyl transferase CsaB [Dictyoglomaceae bacterium]